MSGYITGQYQSESGSYGSTPRGQDTEDRNSNYGNGTVVNYPSQYVQPQSNTETLSKGLFVSVKEGMTLNYFEEPNLNKMVGPSGGKKGQDNPPYREKQQNVGTTTGQSLNGFLQVDWVNSWWQNGTIKNWGGERKIENKRSWVELSKVDVSTKFVLDDDKLTGGGDDSGDTKPPEFVPSTSNFFSDNMLGIAAVGLALVMKKKGKRR